ncbi:hypothetical protein AVEN_25709-1 [Araneus ventricosus]|uniref:Uncharacterized protein n=1 Tax=Araneus ventricosus TaxID=182803 RepID=A0A4Y2M9I3_ARAVE|nr:hypothetical protein AVEN_25709-1 [Araneus ventricosus]
MLQFASSNSSEESEIAKAETMSRRNHLHDEMRWRAVDTEILREGRCRPGSRRVPGSKPDSTEDPSFISLLHVKSYGGDQTSSRWCGAEVWRGVPAQVLSSSPDHGSKSLGPSQNSPRVASKWDVNIAKLNFEKSEQNGLSRNNFYIPSVHLVVVTENYVTLIQQTFK